MKISSYSIGVLLISSTVFGMSMQEEQKAPITIKTPDHQESKKAAEGCLPLHALENSPLIPELLNLVFEYADFKSLAFPRTHIVTDSLLNVELPSAINSALFIPSTKKYLAACFDNCARLCTTNNSSVTTQAQFQHNSQVLSATYIPELDQYLTTSVDRTARLWNVNEEKPPSERVTQVARFDHADTVYSATYHPTLKLFITASRDRTVKMWKIDSENGVKNIITLTHTMPVRSVHVLPNGELMIASGDGLARIWEFANNSLKEKESFKHCGEFLPCYKPEYNLLITALNPKVAIVWTKNSQQAWQEVARLTHADTITSATLVPHQKNIVTTSHDRTAKFWSVTDNNTAQEIACITLKDWINSAQYLEHNDQFLLASHDHTMRLYRNPLPKKVSNPQALLLAKLATCKQQGETEIVLSETEKTTLETFSKELQESITNGYQVVKEKTTPAPHKNEQSMCVIL